MKSIKYLVVLVCMTLGLANVAKAQKDLTFIVKGVSFTMKYVEGDAFQMGMTSEQGYDASDKYDEWQIECQKPVHRVTMSSYYMGETEVTQALWKAVMGNNPSIHKGDDLPVEKVSWIDSQEFIRKLNQLTGKNFRLPTEAEWEYAARGGKKSKGYQYAGSNCIDNVAWYHDNSGNTTHEVKTKLPNELGLYDMSGNVFEWCNDWFGKEYYKKSPKTNPQGPSSSSGLLYNGGRVKRSGAFNQFEKHARVSYRGHGMDDAGDYATGFRLCLPQ